MRTKDFSNSELDNLSLWDAPLVADHNGDLAGKFANGQGNLLGLPTVEEIQSMQQVAFDEASEKGRQEGYEKGLEQGRKKGFEEGRSELDQRVNDFRNLAEQLSEPLKELDEQIETELVGLSIGIAKQLIRRELKTESGQIVAVVREAIQALPAYSRDIRVSMHPDDVELVRSALHVEESSPAWRLEEDPLQTRGGCRVETETSRIDASVESRLAQVIAAVLGGERKQDCS